MSQSAPLPINEDRRLLALRDLDVLDSSPEALFDSLARSAADLCEAPIALLSLVDRDRQWFKAAVGDPYAEDPSREWSFCAHVVASGELLEVPDARADDRFADNPWVSGPAKLRYYAGAPIRLADGVVLGSVCVIDHVPRKLAEHQLQALRHLADIAAQGLVSRAVSTKALAHADRAHRDLVDSHETLQVTLDSIGEAVITTDPFGRVRWMNPAAERITAWSLTEAVDRDLSALFNLVDESTQVRVASPVDLCLGRDAPFEPIERTTLVRRDGTKSGIACSATPIRKPDGCVLGAVLVFRDVSEQRRRGDAGRQAVMHDVLTGLPNRAAFEAHMASRLTAVAAPTRGGPASADVLLYIDLDQFKLVNDACGHAAGDQLLRQIADIVRSCVGSQDMLARLGGDEFGVLLERCGPTKAHRMAQAVCDLLDDFRFVYEGRRFRVGASIGLVSLDARWRTATAALQAASASCGCAKDEGRNRVHRWLESDTALAARQGEMHLVSRIELALDEDRFELHAQRIVAIGDEPHGLHFEVLVRMCEIDGSLTPPGAFLPAAERFHLATRVDRWVVRNAFEWLARADEAGIDVFMMSINLSGQSLGDKAFHRDIVEMIRSAPFDVRRLCFEITETAAITQLAEARSLIEDVRACGVKVALDDFGAGASSFGYLRSLPLDFLKIDGQFVTDLLDDAIDHAAVRCFCDVAKVVGLKTIAEFVESDAVRDELGRIGVDMAQGFLIHEPEPLAELFAKQAAPGRVPPSVGAPERPVARALTEIAFDIANPNRLDLEDEAEVLLWADAFDISVEKLREVVARVGPMRAAIRFYVAASTSRS